MKASIFCGTGTIVDSLTARVASMALVASGSSLDKKTGHQVFGKPPEVL